MSLPSTAPSERFGCPQCLSVFRAGFARCPLDGAALQGLTGDPLIGHLLADRYVIEELLGEGGMGRVYRARHMRMSRRFAVKVLFGDMAADAKARTRFSREAEAVSRLNHPNVLSVVDFGETEEGLLYLVMDYIEGRELHQLLAQEAPLSPQRVVSLLRQLARGLAHAHERNLVHRDFKTENVVVTKSGGEELARIVDFGIAAVGEMMEPAQRLTTEGMVLGTPAYMSPEQSTGEEVDERSDLFSLGVMLYEMLCGRLPFDGTAVAIAKAHLAAEVPPILVRVPGLRVEPRLEAVAMRLMAKDPADRFQSARALLAHLDSAFGPSETQSDGPDHDATVQVDSGQMPAPRAISAEQQLAMLSYQMAELARSQQSRRIYDTRWIVTGVIVALMLVVVTVAVMARDGNERARRAGTSQPPVAEAGAPVDSLGGGASPAPSGTAPPTTGASSDPSLVRDPGSETSTAGSPAAEPASTAEPAPVPTAPPPAATPATAGAPEASARPPEEPARPEASTSAGEASEGSKVDEAPSPPARRERSRSHKESRRGRRSGERAERGESKPAESKPVETRPAESKPAESRPAESRPAESKPAESKPAEPEAVEDEVVSVRQFREHYEKVGKQLERLVTKRGETAAAPLSKRYFDIPVQDAVRSDSLRREADRTLKKLATQIARELGER
ncbi:MAG TPA: protein kinase [Candidatus Acidoferrum sp.]|nr:protein kinase [Candidatus Acidoferrum sp.]